MKLSVSLPEVDIVYLDHYIEVQGIGSRSAALQHAVQLLRESELDRSYEQAWQEWDGSDDATAWDSVSADGMGAEVNAAR